MRSQIDVRSRSSYKMSLHKDRRRSAAVLSEAGILWGSAIVLNGSEVICFFARMALYVNNTVPFRVFNCCCELSLYSLTEPNWTWTALKTARKTSTYTDGGAWSNRRATCQSTTLRHFRHCCVHDNISQCCSSFPLPVHGFSLPRTDERREEERQSAEFGMKMRHKTQRTLRVKTPYHSGILWFSLNSFKLDFW